jgi:hypothetical protein
VKEENIYQAINMVKESRAVKDVCMAIRVED